jgi:hypothetical protein
MIQKEKYADNIYKFITQRKFFRRLFGNLEMNKVAFTFLINIHDRIIKIVSYNLI